MQNPSMSAFLGGLESSGWLKHIKSIIDTSVFVAKVTMMMMMMIMAMLMMIYDDDDGGDDDDGDDDDNDINVVK